MVQINGGNNSNGYATTSAPISPQSSASVASIVSKLKGAAFLDVGTVAGTVAAGDDPRFAALYEATASANLAQSYATNAQTSLQTITNLITSANISFTNSSTTINNSIATAIASITALKNSAQASATAATTQAQLAAVSATNAITAAGQGSNNNSGSASVTNGFTSNGTSIINAKLLVGGGNANIGSISTTDLGTMLDNNGRSLIAWNQSGGLAELNLIISRQSSQAGGLIVSDFISTSHVRNQILTLTGSGNLAVSGTLTSAGNNVLTTVAIGTSVASQTDARITGAEQSTNKGIAGGYAGLDNNGKVPTIQLPSSVFGALVYKGQWNASTNTPALTSSTGTNGYFYVVSAAGSTNLDGNNSWFVGDHATFNGTTWERISVSAANVTTVAGRSGNVSLGYTDISGITLLATQSPGNVAITGGLIDGTPIGNNVISSGSFNNLSVRAPNLQYSSSTTTMATFSYYNDNRTQLQVYGYRFQSGNSWTTAATRIQCIVDSSQMAYIEFNGQNNGAGIGFYNNNGIGLTISGSGGVSTNSAISAPSFVGPLTGTIGATTPTTGVFTSISASSASLQSANLISPYTLGEAHYAGVAFVDPDTGVARAVKISNPGLAVKGGTKTDTLSVTGLSSFKNSVIFQTPDSTNIMLVTSAGVNVYNGLQVNGYESVQHVPNIATLRSLTTSIPSQTIMVDCYATLSDIGGGEFVYVSTDTTSADNGGTIIVDGNGRRWYRLNSGGYKAEHFGYVADGITDNSPALSRAFAALPASGGKVILPPGKAIFNSAVSYTYPTSGRNFRASVSLVGAGADVTVLCFPTNNGGLTLNLASDNHTIHLSDFTVATGQTGANTGITINQSVLMGVFGQNDISRVTVRGLDFQSLTNWWNTGISTVGLSNINFDGVLIFGNAAGTQGNGIVVSGNGALSGQYAIVVNVSKCGFFNLFSGFVYGNYVQGVTITQSNFTNGTTGIILPGGNVGAAELTVSQCQINTTNHQIAISAAIATLIISDNLIYIPANYAGLFINASGAQHTISGNVFTSTSLSGTTGILTSGNVSVNASITGNAFQTLAVGIDLAGGYNFVASGNSFSQVTTSYVNVGTNNRADIVNFLLTGPAGNLTGLGPRNGDSHAVFTNSTTTGGVYFVSGGGLISYSNSGLISQNAFGTIAVVPPASSGAAATIVMSGATTLALPANVTSGLITASGLNVTSTGINIYNAAMSLSSQAGNGRNIFFQTNSVNRFVIYTDGSGETGSNIGSNFSIGRYTDAGGLVDSPFNINRASGLITMGSTNVNGALTASTNIALASGGSLTATDLSKGISVYGGPNPTGSYGFNTTASTLNYTVPTGSQHVMNVNGASILIVNGTGVTASVGLNVAQGGINIYNSNLAISGNAGSGRNVYFQSNLINRFVIYTDSSAETGSNVGSNFYIGRYTDTGTLVDSPFSIARNSGVVSINNLNAVNSLTVGGNVVLTSANYTTYAPSLTGGGASGTWGINVTGSSVNISSYPLNQTVANYSSPTFAGLQVTATNTASLAISGGASSGRNLFFRTGNNSRWVVYTNSTTETGSNNGSDFAIGGYDDAGNLISNPFTITRNTGLVTINNGLSLGSILASGITDLSKGISIWGGGYGLGVTAGALNIVAPAGSRHNFVLGGITAYVDGSGFNGSGNNLSVTVQGGLARGLSNITSDFFNVRNYGALANGGDDLGAINAAMAACVAAGGGSVWFPAGTYGVSGTVIIPAGILIRGMMQGRCYINALPSFTAGDIVQFGNGSTSYDSNGGGICDMGIITTSQRTSGAAIALWGTNGPRIDRCVFGGSMYDGIAVRGNSNPAYGYTNYITDCILNGGSHFGMVFGEANNNNLVQGVWVRGGTCGNFQNGCVIYNGSGIYWDQTEYANNTGSGVLTYPGPGQYCKALYFQNLVCDTNAGNGMTIVSNGGNVVEINIGLSWFATNNGHGIEIAGSGSMRGVSIADSFIFNNQKHGISYEFGSFVEFNNCKVVNNSLSANHGFSGLAVASGLNDWKVMGGRYGTGSEVTTVQQYAGIQVAGPSTRYSVVGADLSTNLVSYADGTTGTPERKLSSCIGAVFEYQGTGTITSGSSSVSIPHYCPLTPYASDVSVSFSGADPLNSNIARIWVGGVDSSNIVFTVNNVVSGNPVTFVWQYRIH